MEDFYELLEVSEDAAPDEINRAWREKARAYHPDVNDDTRANAQFKTLKTAHEVLSDPTERSAYDRLGHAEYVRERLDGLPTADQPGPTAASPGDGTTDPSPADDDHTSGETESPGDDRTSDGNATDRFDREAEPTDRGRSAHASTATGTGPATAGTDHATSTNASSADSGRSSTERSSTTEQAPGIGSPLLYGWVAVLLVGVAYSAGLQQYLRANAAALSGLRAAIAVDPMTVVTATYTLRGPGTFVLETAALDAPLSLLFPASMGLLAAVFTAVVTAFGRGTAYLYLAGGVAPLLSLAAGPFVVLPDGIYLALLVGFPLVATLVFLGDVGRLLFGTR